MKKENIKVNDKIMITIDETLLKKQILEEISEQYSTLYNQLNHLEIEKNNNKKKARYLSIVSGFIAVISFTFCQSINLRIEILEPLMTLNTLTPFSFAIAYTLNFLEVKTKMKNIASKIILLKTKFNINEHLINHIQNKNLSAERENDIQELKELKNQLMQYYNKKDSVQLEKKLLKYYTRNELLLLEEHIDTAEKPKILINR